MAKEIPPGTGRGVYVYACFALHNWSGIKSSWGIERGLVPTSRGEWGALWPAGLPPAKEKGFHSMGGKAFSPSLKPRCAFCFRKRSWWLQKIMWGGNTFELPNMMKVEANHSCCLEGRDAYLGTGHAVERKILMLKPTSLGER